MSNNKFLRNVCFYSLAQIISGVLMIAYTMLAARMLDLSEYGLFQTVMGIYAIIFAVGFPLNIITLHFVGNAPTHNKKIALGMCLRLAVVIGVVCFCFIVLFSKQMAIMFHSSSLLPFILMACLLVVSFVLTVFYGGLQGRNEYTSYSLSKVSEVTISFCVGVMLMVFGLGVPGAVSGYLVGMTIVTSVFVFRGKLYKLTENNILLYQEIKSMVLPMVVACTLFFTSCYPMIIARIRLAEDISGVFGALFTLRNVVQPFAMAVSIPLYSRIISKEHEPNMLNKAIVVILILSSFFIASSLICPELFIRTFFGVKFIAASEYLFLYGINLTLYMFSMVILFYQAAQKTLRTRLLMLPILLIISLTFLPDLNINNIILIQIIAWGALLIGLAIMRLVKRRNGNTKLAVKT